METKKVYVLMARIVLEPGTMAHYYPRWDGKKWSDNLMFARTYRTREGAESEIFMAACADPRVMGHIEIFEVPEGLYGPTEGP